MTEAPLANKAISTSIGRCAESLLDVDRLRGETNVLKSHPGELAAFAAALFELECAKQGDPDARANMLDTADLLLQFWRNKSGDTLAAVHPTLRDLWVDASQMLVSFEKKRLDRALQACFEARGDAALLQKAMLDLTPEGERRVEFATCLYHLELARLFVDTSRAGFARRISLVTEAYNNPDVAKELIGNDQGLEHLWKELVPYLDEFFEAQEQAEEAAAREKLKTDPGAMAAAAPVMPPPPPPMSDPSVPVVPSPAMSPPSVFVSEADLLTSTPSDVVPEGEVEIVESRELTPAPGPLPVPPVLDAGAPPPPPKTVSQDSEVEVIELEEAPPPPPPKRKLRDLDILVDYEPDDEAQAFWRHTEAALGLLPDSAAPRGGNRVLSADGRGERKKLNAWLDGMAGRFTEVPEARAMQCLMRLYMAAQIKEKSLFGQPNPKRKEAFRAALGLLSGSSAAAAGRAAVWFELDGAETCEHLQTGLEVVQDFLQYCARNGKDPLDGAAADEFLGV